MKLLHINAVPGSLASKSDGIYGGERSMTLLCRGLGERGHEVWLSCAQGAALASLAQENGVRVVPIPTRNPHTLPVVWHLVRTVRRFRPDVLAPHGSRDSRIAIMVGRLTGTPVISTMRGLYGAKRFREARHIIAVSEGVRQHILAQGVPPEQVSTVHNGADLSRFVPPADVRAAKRAVGLDETRPVVGLVARLSHEKGHDWFFEAAAPLVQEFPRATFLLVGDGPLRAELEAKAEQLGMKNQVHFAGYQSDIVPWMSAMDFVVLPSVTSEGFARVLIEAGALGKAGVASPVGGNAEAVLEGQTGFIVPVNDAPALSQAMARLLRDPAQCERFGRAMREHVVANFSAARMVEKTEAVYRAVLGRSD